MNDFWLWFSTGFHHILDWNGYDHICYVTCLTVSFPLQQWKKLLVLVTAFTIGHSLTLALSTLHIISPPQKIIECLIPITILSTCVYTIYSQNKNLKSFTFNYCMALCFGFIHGMGFSYLLKSLLGKENSIVGPLFSFNIGLEAGQLLIVAVVLFISLILQSFFRITKKDYVFFVSSAVFGIAFLLLLERIKLD
ncbi:MAG TPA: HupE/UreJ family protein [Bacteroidia bacterium]|nr:HupE/UreJ family protein [Bacteroidia bacterium]